MNQEQTTYQPPSYDTGQESSSMGGMREYTSRSLASVDSCVQDYPVSSVAVAFGAGLGIGMLIGASLAGYARPEQVWHRRTAESLGRRMMDAVSDWIPESVAGRFST